MQVNHHCMARSVAVSTKVRSSLTTVKTNVSDLRVRHHVHVLLIRWCDQPVCIVTRAPSRLRCRQYHPVQITDHTQP